jgi:hypothetical protein
MHPRKRLWLWIAIYAMLDVIAVGMGMGVPIFPILFGFVVGWLLPAWLLPGRPESRRQESARRKSARRKSAWPASSAGSMRQLLVRILRWSAASAAWTFLQMSVIWLWAVSMLFDSGVDIAQFGHPMILYEPVPSFIGWIALMVLVSPFLQLLTTVFAATLRLAFAAPAVSALSTEMVLESGGPPGPQ